MSVSEPKDRFYSQDLQLNRLLSTRKKIFIRNRQDSKIFNINSANSSGSVSETKKGSVADSSAQPNKSGLTSFLDDEEDAEEDNDYFL
jgi:hypothetical protein